MTKETPLRQHPFSPKGFPSELIIALSAKWQTYPERFRWIANHGFGLEYAPNPAALDSLAHHVDPHLQHGVPLRYHGFLPGYEFGHADAARAERGLARHLAVLEAMRSRGQQVITVHVGLDPRHPLDAGRAVENLARLVARGRDLGIAVSLENLRTGPTADPETVASWTQAAGAWTTLDVGHAVSSRRVMGGELTVFDFVELFHERLIEVHVYERETDRHHAPGDMRVLGPVVDRLLDTACTWWTIELDDYAEALATRALLLDYLETAHPGRKEVVGQTV